MKILLKILVLAAAFGLAPGVAVAQHNPNVVPQLTAQEKSALPAQPEDVSGTPLGSTGNPAPAEVAAKAIEPSGRAKPQYGIGMPDGRLGFQDQFTPIGEEAAWFHDMLLVPIITIISLFVLALMLFAVVRYRRSANPTPSRTTHNTLIEVVWTLVPVLILVVIAVPSIKLLARQYSPPKADLTVKVIGNQWYWTYQYPDNGDFEIVSNVLSEEEDKKRGEPRLLGVDERMVVPAGATVKLIITANDVIHSWGVPSFWTKMDAIPGRLNETWFKVDRPGVYYGQCFELCGARHAYMPIAVEVMPPAQFAAWVASKGGTMPGAAKPTSPDATVNSPITNPASPVVTATSGDATSPAPTAVVDATAKPPVSTQGSTNSEGR
jgi:cytochrome c oxidase subunit 2